MSLVFGGYDASRTVFLFRCQVKMLCIFASMEQKDSFASVAYARLVCWLRCASRGSLLFAARSRCLASRPVCFRRTVICFGLCTAGLLVTLHPALFHLQRAGSGCRQWHSLCPLSYAGQASLHSSGVLTVSSGTRLDLWCFDLGLRYQRWRRLLEGIEFVGNFVGLAGLLLSPARQGRCGRMWSPAFLARAGSSGAGCEKTVVSHISAH